MPVSLREDAYLMDQPFAVWRNDQSDADARFYNAPHPRVAAEQRARDDSGDDVVWPVAYCVRSNVTGTIWSVRVGFVAEPSYVAIGMDEVMMPATHVLWHGHVLCEDLRVRGVPAEWQIGQTWASLRDVADGIACVPGERCEACWHRAALVIRDELRGASR